MSLEGSSPNARRATKGGSMSNGKLHGFSERRCTPRSMRDSNPSPLPAGSCFTCFKTTRDRIVDCQKREFAWLKREECPITLRANSRRPLCLGNA
jgi:hypothetical protein